MLRVRIKGYYKGLAYKEDRYVKILDEGTYWNLEGLDIVSYNIKEVYNAPENINELAQDTAFTNAVDIIEIADNERAILIANNLYKQILQPGKYMLWKGLIDYETIKINLNNIEVPYTINKSILNKPEVSYYLRMFVVQPHEKGLLFIDGKFEKKLDAGTYTFIKNETQISVTTMDIRQQQIDINGQEILTKDKANLRINMYAQYKVVDIIKACIDNKDATAQMYAALQLAIREYVGSYTLDELLEKKNEIAPLVLNSVKQKVETLGISISDCGIKDIILPGDVRDIMNKVLIAQKQAQANTITRREETASTRSLLNTAKLMEDNDMLFRLKELEYVEKIADKINGISVSGNNDLIGQLSKIFVPAKNKQQ